jgi:hypothetical protein
MKNLIVQFLLASILSFTSFADLVVPETVDDAFRQKYPNAPEPTWEVDTNGSYEANYKINGVKYRADFTKEGIWSETENNIDFNELPPDVRSAYLLKYSSEDFRDAEAVDSATQGIFYEIEIVSGTSKIDVMFDKKGQIITPGVPTSENGFFQFWMDQAAQDTPLIRQGWSLVYKVVFNLITIYLFAYVIYYRRHHDHKMLFLLLAFNLFLFPIFLSSSLVTAGFGFTIFALLALVRLRSEAFDKAEIAYLLGAISLTFVNTMMPAVADGFSAAIILPHRPSLPIAPLSGVIHSKKSKSITRSPDKGTNARSVISPRKTRSGVSSRRSRNHDQPCLKKRSATHPDVS